MQRPGLTGRLLGPRLSRYRSSLRRARRRSVDREQGGRYGVLSHVVVDPGFRRAGAGRALVESYTGIAALHGTPHLRLTARAGSRAATCFYPKLGWKPGDEHADVDGVLWVSSREL